MAFEDALVVGLASDDLLARGSIGSARWQSRRMVKKKRTTTKALQFQALQFLTKPPTQDVCFEGSKREGFKNSALKRFERSEWSLELWREAWSS
eukprot:1467789-Amphidinium_carterae.1